MIPDYESMSKSELVDALQKSRASIDMLAATFRDRVNQEVSEKLAPNVELARTSGYNKGVADAKRSLSNSKINTSEAHNMFREELTYELNKLIPKIVSDALDEYRSVLIQENVPQIMMHNRSRVKIHASPTDVVPDRYITRVDIPLDVRLCFQREIRD